MIAPPFLTAVPEDWPSFFLIFWAALPAFVFEEEGACLMVGGTRAGAPLAPELVPASVLRMMGGRLSEVPLCSRSPVVRWLG